MPEGYSAEAPETIRETIAAQPETEEDPMVTNKLEEAHDANQDGKLQKEEITKLLEYTITAIERRGRIRASSELLKQFDTDDDGILSRYEISGIKDVLN